MAQWSFVEWLLVWLLETTEFAFDWDDGNRSKSATKHAVAIEEVEQVFRLGMALPLGVQVSPEVAEQRLGIVGSTSAGRVLQVVFTMRGGKIRPISCRPAHRKERQQYATLLRQVGQGLR